MLQKRLFTVHIFCPKMVPDVHIGADAIINHLKNMQ